MPAIPPSSTSASSSYFNYPVNRTLTASDNALFSDSGAIVTANSTSLVNLTITSDASIGWATSAVITIFIQGSGGASFVAGDGVTISSTSGLSSVTQNTTIQIKKTGNNSWAFISSSSSASVSSENYDMLVAGATGGGCMAAIKAARLGLKVCLLSDLEGIGGMVTGGIMWTDVAQTHDKAIVRGLADEFYGKIQKLQGAPGKQKYLYQYSYSSTPRISAYALNEMLANPNLTIYRNEYVVSVVKTGTIVNKFITNSRTINASYFIDATYCGDIIALAGCSTVTGRESTSQYSESMNGQLINSNLNLDYPTSTFIVDPYRIIGDSTSGILPGVFTSSDGTVNATGSNVSSLGTIAGSSDVSINVTAGAASPLTQAFAYRLFITTNSTFRIPFPDPDTYDAMNYEIFGRWIAGAVAAGKTFTVLGDAILLYVLWQANCADTNTLLGGISTDYVSVECTEYITASRTRRLQIEANAKNYILGLIKFLKTDSRVPTAIKNELYTSAGSGNYGFDSREYKANGGFPSCFYIRQGRRLVGDYVADQASVTRQYTTAGQNVTDPIGCSYYSQDSHTVSRYIGSGKVKVEGAYFNSPADSAIGAWVSQKVLYPKVTECTNGMSVFAISASYVAMSTLRMEPMSMIMGEAAGAIAFWAVQESKKGNTAINVQDCPNTDVQKILNLFGDVIAGNGAILSADGTYSTGTVTLTGSWATSANAFGTVKSKHIASSGATATAKFQPNLTESGLYDVYLNYYVRNAAARSTATPVTISHSGGTVNLTFDQNDPGQSGDWILLGSYPFNKGTPSANYVQLATDGGGVNSSTVNMVKWIPKF